MRAWGKGFDPGVIYSKITLNLVLSWSHRDGDKKYTQIRFLKNSTAFISYILLFLINKWHNEKFLIDFW